jgi:hypothetical protein
MVGLVISCEGTLYYPLWWVKKYGAEINSPEAFPCKEGECLIVVQETGLDITMSVSLAKRLETQAQYRAIERQKSLSKDTKLTLYSVSRELADSLKKVDLQNNPATS